MDLYNLFASVVNMSVTASWIIAVVLLARLTLKRAPKIFSYVLWSVVLFRLLCPVSLPSPASWLGALELPSASSREAVEITGTGTETGAAAARNEILTESPSGQPAQVILNETEPDGPSEKTWEDLIPYAAWVWLAGGAAMLLAGVGSCFRFRRHLVGGYRLRGNIYLVDYLGSAFVAGLLRPKIYLPSDLPEEQMDYIIAHEQHHIARLDHLVRHLAYFALCLHWFNPLVWLAFILSGKDMEMSCDEAVLKKLGSRIRADYSASLLRLAMGKRIIAGGPLSFGEGDTKGRIQNLARWKQLKKWQSGLCVLMCLVILTACAANPTQEVVRSKNDGVFESNLSQTAPKEILEDTHIQLSEQFFSTDGSVEFQLSLDQNISTAAMPAVEVVPHNLTGDDVERAAQALLGDTAFYDQEPDSDPQYSKEELQTAISRWSQYTSEKAYSELYGSVDKDGIDALKSGIQSYTELLESAPEENPHRLCDWRFKPENYYFSENPYNNDIIQARAAVDGIDYVLNAVSRVKQDFIVNAITLDAGVTSVDRRILQAQMCRTDEPSQEQMDMAAQNAQEMLDKMDLGTWSVEEPELEVRYYGEIPEYSILVNAVPVLEGAKVLSGQRNPVLTGDDVYSSNYYLTAAFFRFSPGGKLISFGMDSPIEIKSVINSNVSMLSLDELFNIAKNHLCRTDVYAGYGVPSGAVETYAQSSGEKIVCKVTIERLGFGLARVKAANSDENYYYIPAITLYGASDYYGAESGKFYIGSGEPFGERYQALVWINAVDGSVIENMG